METGWLSFGASSEAAVGTLGGIALGGLITWGIQRSRWKREEALRRRERSEGAAGELPAAIQLGHDLLRSADEHEPAQAEMAELRRTLTKLADGVEGDALALIGRSIES